MYKVPVILKKDYIVYFEPSKHGPLVHCEIKSKWTKEVKQALLYDWNDLCMMHNGRLFALHREDQGTKHLKFLKLTGFQFYFKGMNYDVWCKGEPYGY